MLSAHAVQMHTHYVLTKQTLSKPPKKKSKHCIILDVILHLRRGEMHQRMRKGSTVKPQQTLKSSPAELQSWRKIPAGEALKLSFLEESMQRWPSLFNISLSLWQLNNL